MTPQPNHAIRLTPEMAKALRALEADAAILFRGTPGEPTSSIVVLTSTINSTDLALGCTTAAEEILAATFRSQLDATL